MIEREFTPDQDGIDADVYGEAVTSTDTKYPERSMEDGKDFACRE